MVVERGDAAFTVSVNGGTSEHGGGGDLSTVSGTAISGPDYTAPSGTLTLDAGASSATITIRTLNDMLLHRGELLVVVPTGTTTSTGAVTGESTAAQTTIDDQGTITVSVYGGCDRGDARRRCDVHGHAVGRGRECAGGGLVDVGPNGNVAHKLRGGAVGDGSVPGQLAGDAEHHRAYA